jgi:hypothetical protein
VVRRQMPAGCYPGQELEIRPGPDVGLLRPPPLGRGRQPYTHDGGDPGGGDDGDGGGAGYFSGLGHGMVDGSSSSSSSGGGVGGGGGRKPAAATSWPLVVRLVGLRPVTSPPAPGALAELAVPADGSGGGAGGASRLPYAGPTWTRSPGRPARMGPPPPPPLPPGPEHLSRRCGGPRFPQMISSVSVAGFARSGLHCLGVFKSSQDACARALIRA